MDRMALENLRSSKSKGIQKSHSTTPLLPWNNKEALHFAKTSSFSASFFSLRLEESFVCFDKSLRDLRGLSSRDLLIFSTLMSVTTDFSLPVCRTGRSVRSLSNLPTTRCMVFKLRFLNSLG